MYINSHFNPLMVGSSVVLALVKSTIPRRHGENTCVRKLGLRRISKLVEGGLFSSKITETLDIFWGWGEHY